MQPAIQHSADTRRAVSECQQFPPLEQVTRPTVPTAQAAHYLNRRPQTLRGHACKEDARCLDWLMGALPLPVLSAVSHADEVAPHLHVLLLPLADGVHLGGKPVERPKLLQLRESFFNVVAGPAGLCARHMKWFCGIQDDSASSRREAAPRPTSPRRRPKGPGLDGSQRVPQPSDPTAQLELLLNLQD